MQRVAIARTLCKSGNGLTFGEAEEKGGYFWTRFSIRFTSVSTVTNPFG